MKNKLSDITMVGIREDWFEAGRSNEDGTEIVGSSFIVEGETEDGFRFVHYHNFNSGRMVFDDDGFNHWCQDREGDRKKAEGLAWVIELAIKAGRPLNPELWYPTQGCYGSAGWDERAECELEAREREEECWR